MFGIIFKSIKITRMARTIDTIRKMFRVLFVIRKVLNENKYFVAT